MKLKFFILCDVIFLARPASVCAVKDWPRMANRYSGDLKYFDILTQHHCDDLHTSHKSPERPVFTHIWE